MLSASSGCLTIGGVEVGATSPMNGMMTDESYTFRGLYAFGADALSVFFFVVKPLDFFEGGCSRVADGRFVVAACFPANIEDVGGIFLQHK